MPIHNYSHLVGACIIGGYVYRGSMLPGLYGAYLFADNVSNRIWSLRYNGTTVTELVELTSSIVADAGSLGGITSFGEDTVGELYITDGTGNEVFALVPEPCAMALCAPLALWPTRRRWQRP